MTNLSNARKVMILASCAAVLCWSIVQLWGGPPVVMQSLLSQSAIGWAEPFSITSVSEDGFNVEWPISEQTPSIELTSRGPVIISGKVSNSGDLKLFRNKEDGPPIEVTPKGASWESESVDLTGTTTIVATMGSLKKQITVIPADDTKIPAPVILRVSTNRYAKPTSDLGTSGDERHVYGRFLRLSGGGYISGSGLKFRVFDDKGKFLADARGDAEKNDASGLWNVELELPSFPNPQVFKKGFVRAVAIQGLDRDAVHSYSDRRNPVHFEVLGLENELPAPTELTVTIGEDTPITDTDKVIRTNQKKFSISGKVELGDVSHEDVSIVFYGVGNRDQASMELTESNGEFTKELTVQNDGEYNIRATTVIGKLEGKNKSKTITLQIRTVGPRVTSVTPTNAALDAIKVTFDKTILVAEKPIGELGTGDGKFKDAFQLNAGTAEGTIVNVARVTRDENSVTLHYEDVPPNNYSFTVKAGQIKDLFGNTMKEDHVEELTRPVGAEIPPTISRGITGTTGPYVPFPEYTNPRPIIDGFNPSDHVQTRVSRLYYFRDAHRVAQIINRQAKSYNRAAVDMQEQLADKARTRADQATDERRAKERKAVEAAKKTRQAEREQQQAEQRAEQASQVAADAFREQQLAQTAAQAPNLDEQERGTRQQRAQEMANNAQRVENVANALRQRAREAAEKVRRLREDEVQASEEAIASTAVEDRARENQFRREVAAAHTDPDTYAPGMPNSPDPVRQVSVSVIGEGLIQLRGPIKGINIIRTMINQIDAPLGQVRVSVHTVQINGEKGDRMEKVAGKIQRYIDHSRFLTLQSAEMLRKAIVQVAAYKAMQLGSIPGMTQEDRDRSYLYSFFGEDFIRELEVMDSEFLKTGNKLLSIHSMDSTSLASAMFIMALAKNSTRIEILDVFEGMMAAQLPMAEQRYFEAGYTCDGKHKLFTKHCKRCDFQLLSKNARFQSIRGHFDVRINTDDTMTPIQREFVRLAQIFKSRLIVEMELKQRIMERSVIEERLGNRKKDLLEAKRKEEYAKRVLKESQETKRKSQKTVLVAANRLNANFEATVKQAKVAAKSTKDLIAVLDSVIGQVEEDFVRFAKLMIDDFNENNPEFARNLQREHDKCTSPLNPMQPNAEKVFAKRIRAMRKVIVDAIIADDPENNKISTGVQLEFRNKFIRKKSCTIRISENNVTTIEGDGGREATKLVDAALSQAVETKRILRRFKHNPVEEARIKAADAFLKVIQDKPDGVADNLIRARTMLDLYLNVLNGFVEKGSGIVGEIREVVADLGGSDPKVNELFKRWVASERNLSDLVVDMEYFTTATGSFDKLIESDLDYQFARRDAEDSRRPLDHKKFLDLLVDEMEDKYIELLEGTRAHTANIDAYIKRLMTSLDDDFNTQFYYPTFRKVRVASQMWDVQTGQVETTNVLANNRAFAKVSPQATMEFDLPKRDILINEAINGAKATISDIGALAQDPTFLAMARLNSGQPTSSQANGASGGLSTVRNVLPGNSTDTAESVLGQQGPGGSQFGAALESLIPDPAIYKFETGTGWEIRPVIQPDGQAVVFDFNYMYTTNIREPVRADEKHLGRVKRHFVDTDVQLSNFELREISRYTVALKASRTAKGVPGLEDIPGLGVLFRPQPSDESSLQQNIILGQATIFPTLFDLMGLRWAPVVADLDPLRLSNDEFIVRNRRRTLINRVFDHSSSEVDKFLRIPDGERRMDLYRSQESIPAQHPNGYIGPGANLRDSQLQEGYDPTNRPSTQFIPGSSREGSPYRERRYDYQMAPGVHHHYLIPDPSQQRNDLKGGLEAGTKSPHNAPNASMNQGTSRHRGQVINNSIRADDSPYPEVIIDGPEMNSPVIKGPAEPIPVPPGHSSLYRRAGEQMVVRGQANISTRYPGMGSGPVDSRAEPVTGSRRAVLRRLPQVTQESRSRTPVRR